MAGSPPPTDTQPDDTAPALHKGGVWGLLCSSVGLLILWYGIPLSLAGIVLGARARKRARAEGAHAPGSLAAILLGAVGLLLWSLLLAAYALAYDAVTQWQQCLSSANTHAVAGTCDADFQVYLQQNNIPEPIVRALVG